MKVLAAFNSVFVTATQWLLVFTLLTSSHWALSSSWESALGGVTIFPSLVTRFGSAKTDEKPVCAGETKVEKPVCAGETKV